MKFYRMLHPLPSFQMKRKKISAQIRCSSCIAEKKMIKIHLHQNCCPTIHRCRSSTLRNSSQMQEDPPRYPRRRGTQYSRDHWKHCHHRVKRDFCDPESQWHWGQSCQLGPLHYIWNATDWSFNPGIWGWAKKLEGSKSTCQCKTLGGRVLWWAEITQRHGCV